MTANVFLSANGLLVLKYITIASNKQHGVMPSTRGLGQEIVSYFPGWFPNLVLISHCTTPCHHTYLCCLLSSSEIYAHSDKGLQRELFCFPKPISYSLPPVTHSTSRLQRIRRGLATMELEGFKGSIPSTSKFVLIF